MRAAIRFEYNARYDCGCLGRHGSFKLDPNVDDSCQQKNGNSYPKTDDNNVTYAYDRGHMVPANHLDGDETAIEESNYMTNILPQMDKMNRGAWLATEEIIECYRDVEPLHVLGGAVWDSTSQRNDWFFTSHYVKNPVYYWKVITSGTLFSEDNHRIAFWIPNTVAALRGELDNYVVSISTLETNLAQYGQTQTFDVPSGEKPHTPANAWAKPTGCDLSR